jgi:hypothetical protein
MRHPYLAAGADGEDLIPTLGGIDPDDISDILNAIARQQLR